MSKLFESLSPLHEAPIKHLLFREHTGPLLLVAHELSKQDVHLVLVHLVEVAQEYQ
jgi:hypothetical protein